MLNFIWVVLVGLIGGAAVGIQSPIVGAMGQRLGAVAGSLVVHMSGMVLSALLLVAYGGQNIREWRQLPWYMLLSGIFGLVLFQTINITLPRLGSAAMITLIIVGQLLIGLLIDHFGWLGVTVHPVSIGRLFGVAALLLGAYLIAR